MTWLQIVHDIVMAVMIIMGALVFMTLVVRAIGEERRKTDEHTIALIDKSMDKIADAMVRAYKKFSQLEKDEMDEIDKKIEEQDRILKEMDDLWK